MTMAISHAKAWDIENSCLIRYTHTSHLGSGIQVRILGLPLLRCLRTAVAVRRLVKTVHKQQSPSHRSSDLASSLILTALPNLVYGTTGFW
jgi:hypothetical protein